MALCLCPLRARLSTAAALALAFVALVVVSPAHAASLTVTTTADELNADGDCSLREAIQAANTNVPVDACAAGEPFPTVDVIGFGVTGTITLGSTLPTIVQAVAITGPGAAGLTVSGGDAVRVMEVNATVDLSGVTVADGSATGGSGSFPTYAGGILNSGALTITDTVFSENVASEGGGGVFNAGGTLTLVRSTFSGNSAFKGGAVHMESGTLAVTDSTFAGNSAADNGGGIMLQGGTLSVSGSTFSGNTANHGGGMSVGGNVTVTNSTFAGNSALGSFFGGGGIVNGGDLTITNSTFSANYSADNGAAISNLGVSYTLRNTIVANSVTGGNCFGESVDGGGNLQYPGTSCGAMIPSADPLLDPTGLQDNGGPTQTIALEPRSPAIDAAVTANCPTTDQRGVARPQKKLCDIGAFEYDKKIDKPRND